MSRVPSYANENPFSLLPPPRTPGTLGVGDGVSPDGKTIGDTPGSLGVNDAAGAASGGGRSAVIARKTNNGSWSRFLDSFVNWRSISGPQLAWESSAHLIITHNAAGSAIVRDMLPVSNVRERLLWVLSSLPQEVVWTDITLEQWSDKKFWHKVTAKSGQATHFMAFKGQSQHDAYTMGIEKIFGKVEEAVKNIKTGAIGFGTDDEMMRPLANAIHTLQDSFSPAHTKRVKVGDRLVIQRLYVWGEQKSEDHEAGDARWKTGDAKSPEETPLSELGQACYDATVVLLKYYVLLVVNKDAEAEKQKKILMEQYLSAVVRLAWG
jgi:hypothetical protein